MERNHSVLSAAIMPDANGIFYAHSFTAYSEIRFINWVTFCEQNITIILGHIAEGRRELYTKPVRESLKKVTILKTRYRPVVFKLGYAYRRWYSKTS
jgi:hypothetical protein